MDGRRERLHNGRISRKKCPGKKDDLGYMWRLRRRGLVKWSMFYWRGPRGDLRIAAVGRDLPK
jgi:hypothetical protein